MPSYFHGLGFENSAARMKSERHYSGRLTSALRGSGRVNPGAVRGYNTAWAHKAEMFKQQLLCCPLETGKSKTQGFGTSGRATF